MASHPPNINDEVLDFEAEPVCSQEGFACASNEESLAGPRNPSLRIPVKTSRERNKGCDLLGYELVTCEQCKGALSHQNFESKQGHHIRCHVKTKDSKQKVLERAVLVLRQENEALKQDKEALKQDNEALKQDNEALKQDIAAKDNEIEVLKETHAIEKIKAILIPSSPMEFSIPESSPSSGEAERAADFLATHAQNNPEGTSNDI